MDIPLLISLTSLCHTLGLLGIIFQFRPKSIIKSIQANNEDPHQMSLSVTSVVGLHCLIK